MVQGLMSAMVRDDTALLTQLAQTLSPKEQEQLRGLCA
jgi:hypothetical protein